ncbi:MAG: 2-dehydro-3-deoxygluconokinase [Paracoccaceae bacterium]|jgi:2-dehydro-3-deoxygluconokinase
MCDAAIRVACVGEAMVEMSLANDKQSAAIGIAGDTLNTAIYLRRSLPANAEVSYVTAIGTDALSDHAIGFIKATGVCTNLIKRDPSRTLGLYSITVSPDGERSFTYWRDNSAAKTMFDGPGLSFADLASFDVIYLSGITLAILSDHDRMALLDWMAEFRTQGGRVAFDSNYRPQLWTSPDSARTAMTRAWSLADIALPSVDDEMALFGESDEAQIVARLTATGHRDGALKRGILGPRALADLNHTPEFAPAERVIDTTAAGDSFNGGFLGAFLSGQGLLAAMQAGHTLASRVIGHKGAILPPDDAH